MNEVKMQPKFEEGMILSICKAAGSKAVMNNLHEKFESYRSGNQLTHAFYIDNFKAVGNL